MQQQPIQSSTSSHPQPTLVTTSTPAPPTQRKAPLAGIVGATALTLALAGWIGVRIVSATQKQQVIATQRNADAEKNAALAKAPAKVRVVTAAARTWEPVVELDGTLNAGQSAELGFKVTGKLSQINVKVGDVVKAGALLAVLDSSEASAQLRAAQAQVRAAEAQLALADDTERRTSSMVQSGALSEATGVQTAQSKALAQAQADSARAQTALIQVSLGNHRLVAPFKGSITRAPEGIGSVVSPSNALFEVADLSTLKLKGTLSEQDAALVKPGAAVVIATERGNVEGKITTVLGAVDSATRRVRVEASIDNDKEPKLRAGSFARGTIRAGDAISVLELPPEVLRPGSQDELLVVEGDRIVSRRVAYSIEKNGKLLVRFGLDPKDRVVLNPKPELEPGTAVTVEAGSAP
jgi:membrane fusion protein (multidrug efflux system)